MELRHLRYFVAVAEEGSLTVAAEQRLHTAQPSLSRQIRDLEIEVGVPLLTRNARGVELTDAGRAFLDHARAALIQVEAATAAARRAAQPSKTSFAVGFLTGHEIEWLAESLNLLRKELPTVDVLISSDTSPELAAQLIRGKIDVAFMRAEPNNEELTFKKLIDEPLVAILPSDHRLAEADAIGPQDLVGEVFITVSNTAPELRAILDAYLKKSGTGLVPQHEADNLAAAISLIASTRGVAFLPAYAKNFLPWSVISKPIKGDAPTIDLSLGWHTANNAPLLNIFLARAEELVGRVGKK